MRDAGHALFRGLAEADAGVEADPLLRDPRRDGEGEPLRQKGRDLRNNVRVARLVLHRPRLALHVHEAEVGVAVGDHAGELGIPAERGHVVHELRPEGEVRISDGGLTRTPGTLNFDEVTAGDQLPVHHARLSRGDLVNYAGVAGDANPIHWDEDIAKLAGLPDVIAHGMLTMGLGAGFASAWSGDPGAVTRYAVRLSQPVIVSADGADIEYSGRIKSLDSASRTGVVIVGAKSGGRKIFGLATLNVRFR